MVETVQKNLKDAIITEIALVFLALFQYLCQNIYLAEDCLTAQKQLLCFDYVI